MRERTRIDRIGFRRGGHSEPVLEDFVSYHGCKEEQKDKNVHSEEELARSLRRFLAAVAEDADGIEHFRFIVLEAIIFYWFTNCYIIFHFIFFKIIKKMIA